MVRISDQYLMLLADTKDAETLIYEVWFRNIPNLDQIIINNIEGKETKETIDFIPIDYTGLKHFIYNSEKIINNRNSNDEYLNKAKQNLLQAKQILAVSEYYYNKLNEYVWPHISKPSPYGRTYYYGLSLHNVSKELRKAVIGSHYQYDLSACVYAIRLMLAKDIVESLDESFYGLFTCTKEYLDHKSPIRKRLAQHIKSYPDPVKLVKQAISAIGFGARLNDTAWLDHNGKWNYSAITDIIKNPEERHNFENDPWVLEFVEEQKELTKLITAFYLNNSEIKDYLNNIPDIKNKNNNFIQSKVMALLFQHQESKIIDKITEDIPVLVKIHDAFITKKKVNLIEIKMKLAGISEFLSIEEEFCGEFRTDYDDEEVEHKQRIHQEEIKAAQLNNKTIHVPTTKKVTFTSYKKEGFYDGSGYDGSMPYDRELDPFYDEIGIENI